MRRLPKELDGKTLQNHFTVVLLLKLSSKLNCSVISLILSLQKKKNLKFKKFKNLQN